jgi:hypothetical protein
VYALSLRKLAALICALVLLLPLAALFAEGHDCACGMSKAACFCKLTAAKAGAHCDMDGQKSCSMRSSRKSSGAALVVSFHLRGWLRMQSSPAAILAPTGTVPLVELRVPPSFSRSPEPPPPRPFRSA